MQTLHPLVRNLAPLLILRPFLLWSQFFAVLQDLISWPRPIPSVDVIANLHRILHTSRSNSSTWHVGSPVLLHSPAFSCWGACTASPPFCESRSQREQQQSRDLRMTFRNPSHHWLPRIPLGLCRRL